MSESFQGILTRIISERGVSAFDNPAKFNGLLQDYAKGDFKREIRLLIQALEAGYHKELLCSAGLEITIPVLVKKFHDDYGTAKETAEEIVKTLSLVLTEGGMSEEEKKAEMITKLETAARAGDLKSQYELGELHEKLKNDSKAIYWFKEAAKQKISLHEQSEKISVVDSVVQPVHHTHEEEDVPVGFIRIPGGTFVMGSPDSEAERQDNEGPQQQVTVSSFYMGKYEVTQREYKEIMGTNPSNFKGDNLPVECVSWYDAVEYCNRRSHREGLTLAYTIDKNRWDPANTDNDDNLKWFVKWNQNVNGYRLPTEAEWEYACRAGTTTPSLPGG